MSVNRSINLPLLLKIQFQIPSSMKESLSKLIPRDTLLKGYSLWAIKYHHPLIQIKCGQALLEGEKRLRGSLLPRTEQEGTERPCLNQQYKGHLGRTENSRIIEEHITHTGNPQCHISSGSKRQVEKLTAISKLRQVQVTHLEKTDPKKWFF